MAETLKFLIQNWGVNDENQSLKPKPKPMWTHLLYNYFKIKTFNVQCENIYYILL